MAPTLPKVGDYIVFITNDPEGVWDADKPHSAKYGKFVSYDSTSGLKYYAVDDLDTIKTIAKNHLKEKDASSIKKSSWARMRMKAGPNFREAAENVVAFGAYQALVRNHALMGPEAVSFAISELVYELGLKGFVSDAMPSFLGPTELTKDADSFFSMSDFTEPARRIVPIWALTQIIQKYMFRKHWGHEAISNLIGGYGACAVSNIVDRMMYADTSKTPQYHYP